MHDVGGLRRGVHGATWGRIQVAEALALHADLDEIANGGLGSASRLLAARRAATSFGFLANAVPSQEDCAYAHVYLR